MDRQTEKLIRWGLGNLSVPPGTTLPPRVGCPSICKSADCLSAHLSIFQFLGQQICYLQIFHFLSFSVPALHVCLFICRLFFGLSSLFLSFFSGGILMRPSIPQLQQVSSRGPPPVILIRIVSYLGKIEGSDSHGEGLRKILFQANHMLKKVESVNMSSTCGHFQICHGFPPE